MCQWNGGQPGAAALQHKLPADMPIPCLDAEVSLPFLQPEVSTLIPGLQTKFPQQPHNLLRTRLEC